MWPILMQFLRSNAPYLTLPFAAVIGVIGYNLEGYFSDRYTPYNTNITSLESLERTFLMINPDGVEHGILGSVIERFEKKGFHMVALKLMQPSEELLEKHYSALSSEPFYLGLIKYISNRPVVPMVWEGTNIVKSARKMIGATNPADALPGTIRGDLSVAIGRNVLHGSDSVESAKREISLWFTEDELVKWTSATDKWVYGKN